MFFLWTVRPYMNTVLHFMSNTYFEIDEKSRENSIGMKIKLFFYHTSTNKIDVNCSILKKVLFGTFQLNALHVHIKAVSVAIIYYLFLS